MIAFESCSNWRGDPYVGIDHEFACLLWSYRRPPGSKSAAGGIEGCATPVDAAASASEPAEGRQL